MNLKKGHMATIALVDGDTKINGIRAFIADITNDELHYVDVEAPGTCVVPLEQVTGVKSIAKPKSKAEQMAAGLIERPKPEVKPVATKPTAKAPRATKQAGKRKGPTKGDQVLELLKKNPDWIGSKEGKAEAIAAFMSQLDMTKAGANTYYLKYSKMV